MMVKFEGETISKFAQAFAVELLLHAIGYALWKNQCMESSRKFRDTFFQGKE